MPTPNEQQIPEGWNQPHLSPAAVFAPDRITICTTYQVAVMDAGQSARDAHLEAALRHLRAATKDAGTSAPTSRQNQVLAAIEREASYGQRAAARHAETLRKAERKDARASSRRSSYRLTLPRTRGV
ncbi:hypothetical protein SAMN06297387_11210 [Streptomyces zhaozhouensis]|uniref:Uncharacterized protein n=1 Tax=Streptomyces zhaozhouensis TaxID=1300267 RepID=A0A286DYA7_9ACTN|nr:hypothetical protein [Streptomyces zhaozhouensis]SOD63657.1 hypothetical protein SAMN06297387_11210 [Streptomyces zhaozhouensis]